MGGCLGDCGRGIVGGGRAAIPCPLGGIAGTPIGRDFAPLSPGVPAGPTPGGGRRGWGWGWGLDGAPPADLCGRAGDCCPPSLVGSALNGGALTGFGLGGSCGDPGTPLPGSPRLAMGRITGGICLGRGDPAVYPGEDGGGWGMTFPGIPRLESGGGGCCFLSRGWPFGGIGMGCLLGEDWGGYAGCGSM